MKHLVPISGHEFYINLNITSRCNFSCPYCLARGMQQPGMDMSVDVASSIAERVAKLHEPAIINITGGEPTLHPKLYDIVKIFAKSAKQVIVFTNASRRLRHAKCSYIASLHPQSNLKLIKSHLEVVKDLVDRVYIMESLDIGKREIAKKIFEGFPVRIEPLAHNNRFLIKGPRDLLYNGHLISFRELVALRLNRFKGWKCRRAHVDILVNGAVLPQCFGNSGLDSIDMWTTCTRDTCEYEDGIRGEKYLADVADTGLDKILK